ncbi:uncharacterized protein LOC135680695 [Musa acuminata AAA Group]|nr:PREDICTED: uncharacterized protein LOC103994922 [Musa acuminata subsp. malaccensis]CAG1859664.1 unnamed protein product [Musa acuminata subsp. malaccensis]
MFLSMDMAKTHAIMARFRPIAPKPSLPRPQLAEGTCQKVTSAGALRLRAPRSCRARKRGRAELAPNPNKRQRSILPVLAAAGPQAQLSPTYPTFVPFTCQKSACDIPTLTVLPLSPEAKADAAVLVEQDLLQKLQEPRVIVPQPVRPVGSSISVGSICHDASAVPAVPVSKRPEEVEEEVESDELPAVVSDSQNRVRLANSAYKEMVGQPECPWLDSMILSGRGMLPMKSLPRRISGEVMLDVKDSSVPKTSSGFSCKVKIEWACNGRKNLVNVPCNVIRLFCQSRDYLFAWRFDISKASATYCEA